jgi:hypothetical protein
MVIAAVAAAIALCARRVMSPAAVFAARFCQEFALICVLYSIWQILGSLGTVREADGFAHGHVVYDVERTMHIATEGTVERWFLAHPLWMHFCNGYYAIAHAPALVVFLVWLFVRHRQRYPRVRNTVALLTGICLCIHFVPVAPPRLYPDLGFVDAAKVYGESVYGTIGHGLSDQMSAMPSIHVGWALIVAVAVVTISASRWRWLVLLHPALTVLAVTATANHWWLDGIVAGVILAVVVAWQRLLAVTGQVWRARRKAELIPTASD